MFDGGNDMDNILGCNTKRLKKDLKTVNKGSLMTSLKEIS
jgi:hypothetical protein